MGSTVLGVNATGVGLIQRLHATDYASAKDEARGCVQTCPSPSARTKYTHIHTHTYKHTPTYTHTQPYTNMHIHTHTHTHTHTQPPLPSQGKGEEKEKGKNHELTSFYPRVTTFITAPLSASGLHLRSPCPPSPAGPAFFQAHILPSHLLGTRKQTEWWRTFWTKKEQLGSRWFQQ